ncbi:unnamed protein product, partial [Mesorhabditis belari]|uniref:VWFA domain-containing protein n=1 Tax=Mesorhabditis belari TaxID=2138241 RepID=A0AAF3JAZ1_9BILA
MERARLVTIVLLLIALLFLIAGAIMLGIGIHKAKQKKDDCKNHVEVCDASDIGSILHFSVDPGIPWDDTYNDLNAPATQSAIANFSTNITNVLNSGVASSLKAQELPQLLRFSNFAINSKLLVVSPDYLVPSLNITTMFYGTLIFTSKVDPKDVQSALTSAGWKALVQNSSRDFCDNISPTPDPPPIGDFSCDPRNPSRTVIVMVDVALPMDPLTSEKDKLQAIQSYLSTLSLPNDTDWGNFQMGVGVFYGSNAFLINNWLCGNQSCLNDAISKIAINTTSQSHNITRAYEFVRDEFSSIHQQLGPGRARTLTILTDGFEYDNGFGENRSRSLVEAVSQTFYTSTILISNARSVRSTYAQIVPSGYQFVAVDHWYQLGLADIRARNLWWICLAVPVTTPPPVHTPPTWAPITVTTTPFARPTLPTTPTGPPILPEKCKALQVLFLIDMSQSIDAGFNNLTSFIRSFIEQTRRAENARYGYISFNTKVQENSGALRGVNDFLTYLGTTKYTNGYTNYTIGFDAMNDFSSNFDTNSPRAVVFITPGNPNDMEEAAKINSVKAIVESFRKQGIQIIASLVLPDEGKKAMLQNILLLNENFDGEANLLTTATYNSLVATAPLTARTLTCRATTDAMCNLDIVFLVEDSEVVGNRKGQLFAKGAMLSYVNKAQEYIGKFTDRVALAYYSNPDDRPHTWPDRTGIAFNFSQEISYIPSLLESEIRRTIPEVPPGSYSDIALGLQLARSLFGASPTSNGQVVIIFGRGTYIQEDQKCCDEPFNISTAMLDQGIIMKGATVGSGKSEALMEQITGRPTFEVPDYNINFAEQAGAELVDQMWDFRKEASRESNCLQPQIEIFCPDPADIVLIIQMPSKDQENLFNTIKNFTANALLAAFEGLNYGGVEKLTRLAIVTYSGENAELIQSLPASFNLSTAYTALENLELTARVDGPDYLSSAFGEAMKQLTTFGRPYASWSTIVIAGSLDAEDVENATNVSLDMTQTGIYNFAIGTSDDEALFVGLREIMQRYTLIDGTLLDPPEGVPAVYTANEIRNNICAHYPGEGIPTDPPATPPPPTQQPGFLPQGLLASQTWPDICILIDTSADFAVNNTALNDRGFEVLRMFLINTLIRYKIGDEFTRIALVTFDGNATAVINFNTYSDWPSLYKGLTEDWQYGPSANHQPQKSIDVALDLLRDVTYQPKNGFRNKVNFLWVFTTGNENLVGTNYQAALNGLGQGGVTVMGIGLGNIESSFMKTISSSYVRVTNYTDPLSGMASQLDLVGPLLYQTSTGKQEQPPPFAFFKSDVVIAIDREMPTDLFNNVKDFLGTFVQQFTIGKDNSRIALVVFDSTGITTGILQNQQFDQASVLNNIKSLQAKGGTTFGNGNYDKAIDFILANVSSTANDNKRLSAPSFAFFFTANNKNDPLVQNKNLTILHEQYVVQVLCLDNMTVPDFAKKLASKEQYAYPVGLNLDDWSIRVTGERSPIQSFFTDLQITHLEYLQVNDLSTRDIAADITLVYDFANLDNDLYQIVLTYLKDFVKKFSIGVFGTQISGLCFADQILYEFPFMNCDETTSCIEDAINKWTFKAASNSSLLVEALDRVAQNQFTISNNWRQSKSYVLVFSAQNNTTWNPSAMSPVRTRLQSKNAFTYYVDMSNGGLPEGYRKQFFDNYEQVESPKNLSNQADPAITTVVTSNYQGYKYPPPLGLQAVIADFVFVVDSSVDQVFNEIRTLLLDLITQLPISSIESKISLLSYNENGFISANTFRLADFTNPTSLKNYLNGLTPTAPTNTTDFGAALSYLNSNILQRSAGYRENQTFVTFFNANPKLTTPLDNYVDTISQLQSRQFVSFYGFDMASSDSADSVYSALRRVIPIVMSATQIVRTSTVAPTSSAIIGGNGYYSYISNVYGAYAQQPTPAPVTQFTPTPTISTTIGPPDLSNSWPLDRIKTDLLFIIDPNLMTEQTFSDIKSTLYDYAAQFLISPELGSQFGVLSFDGTNEFNSFRFSASTDLDTLQSLITGFMPVAETRPTFALAANLNRAITRYFANDGGYRGNSATLAILTGNTTIDESCSELRQAALGFPIETLLFGLSLYGEASFSILECAVSQIVATNEMLRLNVNEDAMKRLSMAVSKNFESSIPPYPTVSPVDPVETKIDVVFIMDVLEMTDDQFNDAKLFMRKLVGSYSIMNDTTGMQFSVMTYSATPQSNVTQIYDSFTFLQSQSMTQLRTAIDGLVKSTDATPLGIERMFSTAITMTLGVDQGHFVYKPISFIVLGSRNQWDNEKVSKYRAAFPIYSIDVSNKGAISWLSYLSTPENLYRAQGILANDDLLTRNVQGFLSQAYFNNLFTQPLPSKSVSTDVYFIIDSSNSFDANSKSNLINSLISFTNLYNLAFTRFGFLFYGQSNSQAINFDSYKSFDGLALKLNETILGLNTTDSSFDLQGAFNAASNYLSGEISSRGGPVVVTIAFTDSVTCPTNTTNFPPDTIHFVIKSGKYQPWLECIASAEWDLAIIQNGNFQNDYQTGRLVATVSRAARYIVDEAILTGNPLNNAKPKDLFVLADFTYFSKNLDINRMRAVNAFTPTNKIVFDLNGLMQALLTSADFMDDSPHPKVVILVMSSPEFTKIDSNTASALRSKASVFGISAVSDAAHLDEILRLNGGSTLQYWQQVYSPDPVADRDLGLLIANLAAGLTVPQAYPPTQIQADYLFVLDGTTEMESSFNKSIDLIRAFASKLSIFPGQSRVGVLSYGNDTWQEGFSQKDAQDLTELTNFLNSQTPINAAFTSWNAVGALRSISDSFYDNRLTFVYILAATPNFGTDCAGLSQITLKTNMALRGISFGSSQTVDSLRCVVGSGLDDVLVYPANTSLVSARFLNLAAAPGIDIVDRFLQKDATEYEKIVNSMTPSSPISISQAYQPVTIYYEVSAWIDETTFNQTKDFILAVYNAIPSPNAPTPRLQLCEIDPWKLCFGVNAEDDIISMNYTASNNTNIQFSPDNTSSVESLKWRLDLSATSIFLAGSPGATGMTEDYIRAIRGQGNVIAVDLLGLGASTAYLNRLVSKPSYLRKSYEEETTQTLNWVYEAITTDYEASRALLTSLSTLKSDVILMLDVSSVVTNQFFDNSLIPSAHYLISKYIANIRFGVYFAYNKTGNPFLPFDTNNVLGSVANSTYAGPGTATFDVVESTTDAFSRTAPTGAYSFVYLTLNPDGNYTDCLMSAYSKTAVFYFDFNNLPPWTNCATSSERVAYLNETFAPPVTTTRPLTTDIQNVMDMTLGRANFDYFLTLRQRTLRANLSFSPTDLIVVMDANSMLSEGFTQSMIYYLGKLVALFDNVQAGALRFGFVFAGSEPIVMSYLNQTDDIDGLLANITKPSMFVDARTNLKLTLDFVQDQMLKPENGRREGVSAVILVMLQNENILASDMLNSTEIAILNQNANIFGMNIYGSRSVANTLMALTMKNLKAYDVIWDEYYLKSLYEMNALSQISNFIYDVAIIPTSTSVEKSSISTQSFASESTTTGTTGTETTGTETTGTETTGTGPTTTISATNTMETKSDSLTSRNIDIIFLLDTSAYAQPYFDDYIQFVKTFLTGFTVSAERTRIGFVTVPGDDFATFPFAPLGGIDNSEVAFKALDDIKNFFADFDDSGQFAGAALDTVRQEYTIQANGYRTQINNHWIIYLTSAPT